MADPLVSVVIPAYNRAATIRSAILSVLHQTWEDFEVLVVDDGSRDNTVEIVRSIEDPRIRLLNTPRNMGASGARNLGIREARGTWIAFQDSDDEWLPYKLERQMSRLLAPGAGYVAGFCGMLIIGSLERNRATPRSSRCEVKYIPSSEWSIQDLEEDILKTSLVTSVVSTQTLVARKESLVAIGGFDENLRALVDWECVIRLAQLGTFAFVDEPLVLQRFSGNSITRNTESRNASRLYITEKHLALLAKTPSALAAHYYREAGSLRNRGELVEAIKAVSKSCRLDPGRLKHWGMLAYLSSCAPLLLLSRRRDPAQTEWRRPLE